MVSKPNNTLRQTTILPLYSTPEYYFFLLVMARTMFDVHLFKAKNRLFEFNYQKMNTFEFISCLKNDVQLCWMSNLFSKSVNGPNTQ